MAVWSYILAVVNEKWQFGRIYWNNFATGCLVSVPKHWGLLWLLQSLRFPPYVCDCELMFAASHSSPVLS